jgi:hypothetical protein
MMIIMYIKLTRFPAVWLNKLLYVPYVEVILFLMTGGGIAVLALIGVRSGGQLGAEGIYNHLFCPLNLRATERTSLTIGILQNNINQ